MGIQGKNTLKYADQETWKRSLWLGIRSLGLSPKSVPSLPVWSWTVTSKSHFPPCGIHNISLNPSTSLLSHPPHSIKSQPVVNTHCVLNQQVHHHSTAVNKLITGSVQHIRCFCWWFKTGNTGLDQQYCAYPCQATRQTSTEHLTQAYGPNIGQITVKAQLCDTEHNALNVKILPLLGTRPLKSGLFTLKLANS